MDVAVRAGYGFDTAIAMTPRQLICIAAINSSEREASMLSSAIAARVAQADKKGWKSFVESMSEK